MTPEQKQLVYCRLADRPEEWADAERIASRTAETHDVSQSSGSEWVWETFAILEAEGRLPMATNIENS